MHTKLGGAVVEIIKSDYVFYPSENGKRRCLVNEKGPTFSVCPTAM